MVDKTTDASGRRQIFFSGTILRDSLQVPTASDHADIKKRILVYTLDGEFGLRTAAEEPLCGIKLQIRSVRNEKGNIDWEYTILTNGKDIALREEMGRSAYGYMEMAPKPVAWPLIFSTSFLGR